MAKSPVKGKYDQAVDTESAFEMLQKRLKEGAASASPASSTTGAPAETEGGGLMGGIGRFLGGLFGTNRPRGQRLSTTQTIAREVTRTVTNRVAGQIAADLGKAIGGKTGGTIGRSIVRGTLGGILRR
jgi:hypothetical protein